MESLHNGLRYNCVDKKVVLQVAWIEWKIYVISANSDALSTASSIRTDDKTQ